MALVEGMRAKMAWYAKEHDEKHQSASAEKKREVAPASCNATLRMVQESVMPWETLSNRIMAGVNLAVGDKVDFRLKTGEDVRLPALILNSSMLLFSFRYCVFLYCFYLEFASLASKKIDSADTQNSIPTQLPPVACSAGHQTS